MLGFVSNARMCWFLTEIHEQVATMTTCLVLQFFAITTKLTMLSTLAIKASYSSKSIYLQFDSILWSLVQRSNGECWLSWYFPVRGLTLDSRLLGKTQNQYINTWHFSLMRTKKQSVKSPFNITSTFFS